MQMQYGESGYEKSSRYICMWYDRSMFSTQAEMGGSALTDLPNFETVQYRSTLTVFLMWNT